MTLYLVSRSGVDQIPRLTIEHHNPHFTAHQSAFKLGILHRDISAGNIIIVCGRGVLIDWDLSKSLHQVRPRQITRTVC